MVIQLQKLIEAYRAILSLQARRQGYLDPLKALYEAYSNIPGNISQLVPNRVLFQIYL